MGGKVLKGTVYVEVQGLGNEEMLLVQRQFTHLSFTAEMALWFNKPLLVFSSADSCS